MLFEHHSLRYIFSPFISYKITPVRSLVYAEQIKIVAGY